jgi:hypothetical protein
MTLIEYLLNLFLVGLVVLQIRGHKVTKARLVFPLVVTIWLCMSFLHGLPTAGNDLALVAGGTTLGATLGALAALATAVRRDGPSAFARAGTLAAVFWVAGIGARVGFSLWVSHGGAPAIARFSAAHDITSGSVWATAFILMAMAEVATRTAGIYLKARRSGAVIERGGLLRSPAVA